MFLKDRVANRQSEGSLFGKIGLMFRKHLLHFAHEFLFIVLYLFFLFLQKSVLPAHVVTAISSSLAMPHFPL